MLSLWKRQIGGFVDEWKGETSAVFGTMLCIVCGREGLFLRPHIHRNVYPLWGVTHPLSTVPQWVEMVSVTRVYWLGFGVMQAVKMPLTSCYGDSKNGDGTVPTQRLDC